MSSPQALRALRQLWPQRTPRERRLLTLGLWFLLIVAVWQWALAPAWQTWQQAPAEQARLAQTTLRMQQWQAQARQWQATARPERAAALQILQKHLPLLGEGAKVSTEGELWRVQLPSAPASGLAQWLSLVREQAQVLPQQAELQQLDGKPGSEVRWKGSLSLRQP